MFKKMVQFFLGEPEGHISELDKFISTRSRNIQLSESQRQEINKYQRIAKLRDPT